MEEKQGVAYFREGRGEDRKTSDEQKHDLIAVDILTGRRLITEWGDAPPHMEIFGRQEEISWLMGKQEQGVQIFCLVGYGGIGKSTLARNWADAISDKNEVIAWISFKNRPNMNEVFRKIQQLLEPGRLIPAKEIETHIAEIVNILTKKRTVLIFDNLESVMKNGDGTGSFLEEFRSIERFIKRFADAASESVLLLTTRELPSIIEEFSTSMPSVCQYKKLGGLDLDAVSSLVSVLNLTYNTQANLKAFSEHHGGSPYAISLTAPTIINDYGGVIDKYVLAGCPLPSKLMKLLDTQISRLTELQMIILFHLAVARVPVTLKNIQESLHHHYFDADIIDAVEQLRNRSLLEPPGERGLYTIQNVLLDYATDRICREMTNSIIKVLQGETMTCIDGILRDLPILTATAPKEIRDAQLRTLVKPIYKAVSIRYSGNRLKKVAYDTIRVLGNDGYSVGYATGTLVTMMIQQSNELNKLDFSGLNLWSCDFETTDLVDTSFRGCDLRGSRFREVLSAVSTICFGRTPQVIIFGTSDGIVHFQNIETRVHYAKKVHLGYVRSIAYDSREGTILTVGEDKTVHILSEKDLLDRTEAIIEEETLRFITASEDGTHIAWGGEKGLLVRKSQNGLRRDRLLSGELIRDCCFFDDYIAFVTESGTIVCGGADDDISEMCSVALHDEPLWCISANGGVLTVSGKNGIIRRFTRELKETGEVFEEAKSPVWHILPSENHFIAATSSGALLFYAKCGGEILYRVPAHENWVRALAVDRTGKYIASGGADQAIRVYSENSRDSIFDLEGETINFLSIIDTGEWVVAGGTDGILHCWSGNVVKRLHRSGDWIRSLAFSSKLGLIAIGYKSGLIELFDPKTEEFQSLGVHPGGDVWSLDFHPEKEVLVSAGEDGQVLEWKKDLVGNWKRKTLFNFNRWAIAVRYSPDGNSIACGDGLGRVVICFGDRMVELDRNMDSDQAWGIAWDKTGKNLLVAERSTKMRLWTDVLGNPKCDTLSTGGEKWGATTLFKFGVYIATGDSGEITFIESHNVREIKVAEGRIQAVSAYGDSFVVASFDGIVLRINVDGTIIQQYFPDRQYSRLDVSNAFGITEFQLSSIKQFGGIID